MANEAPPASSSESVTPELEEDELVYGGGSGWVGYALCEHPDENWLCLCCKDVLCSRFVNKRMAEHNLESGHSLALSFSDLSVRCYACEAYLDALMIEQLHLFEQMQVW